MGGSDRTGYMDANTRCRAMRRCWYRAVWSSVDVAGRDAVVKRQFVSAEG